MDYTRLIIKRNGKIVHYFSLDGMNWTQQLHFVSRYLKLKFPKKIFRKLGARPQWKEWDSQLGFKSEFDIRLE